jgi:drug/metabolite transporter (DMT)-like permease
MSLTPRQWAVLVVLTLIWGINWPIMKLGVTGFPPLTFRALSMWLGLPVLGAVMLAPRQLAGVAAAALGVALLLWHELAQMAGRPLGALGMLVAAAAWAFGTQQMRRTRLPMSTLALAFWMTVLTTLVMTVLAVVFEHDRWSAPTPVVWGAIVFNAIGVFGCAQPAWLMLARSLPPVASTLSVMLIPVLGVASGALALDETLHWQDGAAVVLMVVAIASVLWPRRGGAPAPSASVEGAAQR